MLSVYQSLLSHLHLLLLLIAPGGLVRVYRGGRGGEGRRGEGRGGKKRKEEREGGKEGRREGGRRKGSEERKGGEER